MGSNKMQFPLDLSDIILWLAVAAIILLITSEIISPYSGKMNILIDRQRLRKIALIVGLLFMITVFLRIFQMST